MAVNSLYLSLSCYLRKQGEILILNLVKDCRVRVVSIVAAYWLVL